MFKDLLRIICACGICASCASNPATPTVRVIEGLVCNETGFVNGQCDSSTDVPLVADVKVKDINGNTLTSTSSEGGSFSLKVALPEDGVAFIAAGQTTVSPDGLLCLTGNHTTMVDGETHSSIAYTKCGPKSPDVQG